MSDELVITTKHGAIAVRLRPDKAPKHCEFVRSLARAGSYSGCVFYRAERGFVLQGGLRDAQGNQRPTGLSNPPLECNLPNLRGTVTMARWEDPNSGAGEFFINLGDSPHLDKTGDSGWALGFTVFGEVDAAGLQVAENIAGQATTQQGGMSMLVEPVVMDSVTLR